MIFVNCSLRQAYEKKETYSNHSLKAQKQLIITLQHRLIIKMSQYTEHLSNIG